jgi:UDP-N-acetylglucosamine/UDP-N-acetylgalactosamine diphosphorylase
MTHDEAYGLLRPRGQDHVLRFWDRLDDAGRARLLAQIASLDLDAVERMKAMLTTAPSAASAPAEVTPAPVLERSELFSPENRRAGDDLLRAGRAGVLLVAGGQGSRLGFDGPKGVFPVGPVSHATLFEIHSRKVAALERKYGAPVPFYIMTSEVNDAPTRAFFEKHDYFGLAPDTVRFFIQGMGPALWPDGRMVLERPDRIFVSPDGHGGILEALRRSGSLDDMTARGLSTLYYFQVDNPLVEIADPGFLGIHARRGADVSVKVCAKRDAAEGLGVSVLRGGRPAIVEYTELTDAQKNARLPDGALRFRFGSVAIHVFSLAFLRREADGRLPLHVAHKKVPFCGDDGRAVEPDRPNAYKFEKFIFDVLPDAGTAVNVEFAREDEFSPVKNATGNDSPDTARRDMTGKFARWLAECGVDVPRDAAGRPAYKVEIDPCFALGPEDLRARIRAGLRIEGDLLLA